MRLVDADALLKRKGCVYDSEGHVLFAVGTGDIVHAPTIDAIPVKWLKKVRKDDRLTIDDEETIDLILTWWQEKHEVQK